MARRYSHPRRYPRTRTHAPMFLELLAERDYQGFAQAHTVGAGGCGFTSSEPLGYRTLMKVSFSVGGKVISADGRVAYEKPSESGGFDVGVEFLRVAAEDRLHLQKVVGQLGR